MRGRAGRRLPADRGAGARLSGQQGGLVGGRGAAERPLPRGAVRRARLRALHSTRAAAEASPWRSSPTTSWPSPTRSALGPLVHLVGHDWGSVQGWEFATVARTEGRIASFTSISGPSLDHLAYWSASGPPVPRRGGWPSCSAREPGPGTCTCCTPPGCRRRPGAAGGKQGPGCCGWRSCPGLRLSDGVAAGRRRARRLALPRQHPRPAAPPAHRRLRPRARPADHPDGDADLSERLYDDLEQWAPGLVRRNLAAKHWVPRTRPDQVAAWIAEFATARQEGARPREAAPAHPYARWFAVRRS
ncbi:hypothetical protein MAUB1S_03688 [Mycolicibacterium aubagnense]